VATRSVVKYAESWFGEELYFKTKSVLFIRQCTSIGLSYKGGPQQYRSLEVHGAEMLAALELPLKEPPISQACRMVSSRITESQNSRGWKGPLWVI